MNEYLIKLLQKHKQKGILVDTNLMLLYLVGLFDPYLIRNFSRTAMFTENDFERVSKFIDYFDTKIIVPHVLTEVSDFIDNRHELHAFLKVFIETSKEIFIR